MLADCAAAGVDAVTIGQYLQPDAGCLPVARYVEPAEFAAFEKLRRGARPAGRRGAVRALVIPCRRAAATTRRRTPRGGPSGDGSCRVSPPLATRPMTPAGLSLPLPTPELVMFDLDYTLLRPSDQFEAPGYVRTGARFGLELDAARWPQAERAAYAAARERRRRTGLVHDDGLLPVIAHAIIEGLGGGPPGGSKQTAAAIVDAWGRAENFGLYDDVVPCLGVLRGAGVRMALVSNALGHGLEEVVAHFALDDFICAGVSSARSAW